MTQMYSILDSRLPIITYDQQVLILKFKLKTSSAYKPILMYLYEETLLELDTPTDTSN